MSDYFNLHEIGQFMHDIFIGHTLERLAGLQRISKRWREIILCPDFIRRLYERDLNVERHLTENHRELCPVLTRVQCPQIHFPVSTLVGSNGGLVCMMDRTEQVFILNPLTRRYKIVIGDTRPFRSYAFGYQIMHSVPSLTVVKVLHSSMRHLAIFSLHTNQWREVLFMRNENNQQYQILEGVPGAFTFGSFVWMGRVTRGNEVREALITYNATTNTLGHLHLPDNMCGMFLRVVNIGPESAAVYGIGTNCFWRINNLTGEDHFERVLVRGYPSGVSFQPLCWHGISHTL
ncbi:uncharacterized protein LOC126794133 isoform X2 [Argentina anserina]|uniref:uncharacterized protein LOC126794133 isoform X2 n=1 Tax=Argentina anserina TaxID=57926 RepID=UPI002176200B|nr:uncharacterized protein LOC126794133 isoform X2 [Potentilla anserina]